MGFDSDFIKGWGRYLNAATPAEFAYSEAAAYAPTVTAITLGALPQNPDRAVALATYPVTDDPSLSDSIIGLQVLTRAPGPDPTAVADIRDAFFDVLHGLTDIDLPTGIHVVQCLHQSGGLLGRDEQQRWTRSDNYYVTVWRPSPNRT